MGCQGTADGNVVHKRRVRVETEEREEETREKCDRGKIYGDCSFENGGDKGKSNVRRTQ